MTSHAYTDPDDATPASPARRREYAAFTTGADETVIYDCSNHRAWIQSDAAVTTDDMA